MALPIKMYRNFGIRTFLYLTCATSMMAVALLPQSSISAPQHSVSGQCRSSVSDAGNYVYADLADVNIGGFILEAFSAGYNLAPAAFQISEAIAYAVKVVNEDPNLLPNVSLGFVLLNEGLSSNVAVAKALQFIPHMTPQFEAYNNCLCRSTGDLNPSGSTDQYLGHYDVVGVISPSLTSMTVPVSYVMSAAKIPLISLRSSGDELSDTSRHPYFLRLTPPSKLRMEAMMAFIHSHGWSYISLLYCAGPVGESQYESIKNLAPSYNICLGAVHNIKNNSNYNKVVDDLLKYVEARVVILLITYREVKQFFRAINGRHASGRFIWISTEALGSLFGRVFKGYENDISGTFIFSQEEVFMPKLYQHMGQQKIISTTNPWLKPSLEYLLDCSFAEETCDNDSSILDASDFIFMNFTSLYVDTVMVFAHAATKLLTELCHGQTGREARRCIQGQVLLEYIRNVSIEGYSGHISFDTNRDRRQYYTIYQIGISHAPQNGNSSSVLGLQAKLLAFYNISQKEIKYTGENISWDHLIQLSCDVNILFNSTPQTAVPESVCSKPCPPGEHTVHQQPHCCWECLKCPEHHRFIKESTTCTECQPFTWPDPETSLTTCRDIPASLPSLRDPVAVLLIFLGLLDAACAVIISAGFVHYRASPVIKASSLELSCLQLVAVGVGCFTVILLQLPPSGSVCETLYFTFSLSFTWLYSPLLVKSVRIYRIFLGNTRYHRNPRFVSWRSQVILTMTLISIQIIVCLVIYIIYKPTAMKNQPVASEKYVELTCNMTLPGLVSFLVYNLVLVAACSVLAFKTRKLPDNFNESWFIFMCVITTLILWLAFVPTYFTSSQALVRRLMLSLAILLNLTVTLVFLFIPKIYAAVHTSVEIQPTRKFYFSTVQTISIVNRAAPTSATH